MGLLDKIKGLIKGKETQIKGGIDKAADAVQSKTNDKQDAQVEKVADAAKAAVDKLDGN
jgi:hypothetical protein